MYVRSTYSFSWNFIAFHHTHQRWLIREKMLPMYTYIMYTHTHTCAVCIMLFYPLHSRIFAVVFPSFFSGPKIDRKINWNGHGRTLTLRFFSSFLFHILYFFARLMQLMYVCTHNKKKHFTSWPVLIGICTHTAVCMHMYIGICICARVAGHVCVCLLVVWNCSKPPICVCVRACVAQLYGGGAVENVGGGVQGAGWWRRMRSRK